MSDMTAFMGFLIQQIAYIIAQPPLIYFMFILLFLLIVRIVIILLTLGKGGK